MGRKAKLSEAKRSAAAAYFIESRQALQSGSVIVDATSSASKCLLTEAESSSTAATFTPLSPALTMAELASSTGMIFDAGSSALSLANTSNAGRFYVAAKPIAAGDLILDTAVHAAVVCEGLVSHVCAFCMKRSDSPLQLCSSCGYVAFCSNKCKDMCAEIHDLECASLANLRQRTSGLSPEALTWLRLVLQDAVQGASSPAKFLCSSVGTVSKTKRKAWQRIATALRNFCGDALPSDWSTQRAFEILSACENNCFGIWQDGKSSNLQEVYVYLQVSSIIPAFQTWLGCPVVDPLNSMPFETSHKVKPLVSRTSILQCISQKEGYTLAHGASSVSAQGVKGPRTYSAQCCVRSILGT